MKIEKDILDCYQDRFNDNTSVAAKCLQKSHLM